MFSTALNVGFFFALFASTGEGNSSIATEIRSSRNFFMMP